MTTGPLGAVQAGDKTRRAANARSGRRDFLLVSAAAALAAGVVFAIDPATGGFYPPCPTHVLTGLFCPGCGSLRAIHALLHGDFTAAAGRNLLVVALTPYLIYEYVSFGLSAFGARVPRRLFSTRAGAWFLIGAIAAFTILRNIPLYPFSLLAP